MWGMSPKPKSRVALYARISQDDSGESLGVARQFEDLRAMALDRGWEVVAELHDNDVSAFSGARRPGYEQLLSLVRAGGVDRVAVWHLSRLWRNRPQRMAGMETFRASGVGILAVTGPELDFSTATGRMLAELLAVFDSYESDLKGERVARATLQRVQSGGHSGDLGYGWRKAAAGGYVTDRAQAKVVREIVTRLTAGESVRGLTDDLNRRGVASPGAGQSRGDGTWGKTSVRKVALRPSNAGLVVHQGEVIGEGTWPAIVTREEHEAVKSALTRAAQAVPGNPTGASQRVHMLTFTDNAVCGVCGERLRVATKRGRYGAPQVLYVCSGRGCTGRKRDAVDAWVTSVVLERLRQPDLASVLDSREADLLEAERDALLAKREDAKAAFMAGAITATMLGELETELAPLIVQAESRLVASTVTQAVDPVADLVRATDPEALWQAWTPVQRLAVIQSIRMLVRIMPTKGGPGFDPESVEISWGAAA